VNFKNKFQHALSGGKDILVLLRNTYAGGKVAPVISRDALIATFGSRVRARRLSLGMKQEALASAVGYENHTNIVKIEGGMSFPSFDKAVAIAEALGVSLDALLAHDTPIEVDFPRLTRIIKATPKEVQRAWIDFLRAFADDLERQEHTSS
jgi:transcriptional regulator with XRE-family HTH domain